MKPHSIQSLIAIALFLFVARSDASDGLFQVEYRDGTVIAVNFLEKTLPWTAVSDLGRMSKQQIEVAKIQSLTLTLEPASAQLSTVLKLIAQLDADDFHLREAAEQELRKTGKRFRSVIQRTDSLTTPDGNFRLTRVLSSLKVKPNSRGSIELDHLVLNDGTQLSGDAGSIDFPVEFQSQTVNLQRKQISRITRAVPIPKTRSDQREVVETKLFHNHADFMQDRDLRMVDFEHEPDGTALDQFDKNVSSKFVDIGLELGTEFPKGCVGIAGAYEIVAGNKPVGGNSVCVYQSQSGALSGKRFKGVMEITFCQPGKKSIPQGVKDFGLFVSRVDHSRDILVEAWDSMGRLIGVCESNDEPCTFCGISSSVPIAKIRVLSNPWILEARQRNALEEERSRQRVDKDYAVDSMMFSSLVPIDSTKKERHFFSRNGDMIPLNWVRVFDKDRIEFGSRHFQLLNTKLGNVNSMGFRSAPKTLPRKINRNSSWMAMLNDNSVLKWDPGSPLRSTTLKQDLNRDDVIAIWPATHQPHMPLQGDFDAGKNVLVYPGCRVATPKVDFDANGFRWSKGVVKTAMLHDDNEFKVDARDDDEPDDVSPTKSEYSLNVSKLPEFEIPTIWFKPPTSVPASHGILRLDSGETLVYGENANFQLQSIDKTRILLAFRGNEFSVPLNQVISILPTQD